MIDETAGSGGQSGSPEENTGQTEAAGARVAFCQQCGRELTAETVRRVGSAVYCEPCLVARLEGRAPAPGAGPAYAAVDPGAPYGAPVPPPPTPDVPSPGVAAILGLIPGVGAMYNGQFAKGVAHLVIFAILVSLADNVNGIFGLFVAGWIFFQSFEAYHTARARRDGLPLPNAFGLNDIGDRLGFGRNWPGSAARPVSTAWTASQTASQTAAQSTSQTATPPPPPSSNPNWAGYVPPTHFGATATPPPPPPGPVSAAEPYPQPPPAAAWNPTFAANPWASPAYGPAAVPPPLWTPPARRFPVGALWLIGLGLLFLLSNLAPGWRIAGHWLLPIILAALAIWLLYQRVEMVRRVAPSSPEADGLPPAAARRLACYIRGPVMLLVLAVLFSLQAAHVFTLGQTWPVIFIALGALLLIERTLGRSAIYPPVGMAGPAEYGRAAWAHDAEPRKDSGGKP